MAKWLEQASQWHEMYCHDVEVMSSNPGRIELGELGTSVLSRTWSKNKMGLNKKSVITQSINQFLYFLTGVDIWKDDKQWSKTPVNYKKEITLAPDIHKVTFLNIGLYRVLRNNLYTRWFLPSKAISCHDKYLFKQVKIGLCLRWHKWCSLQYTTWSKQLWIKTMEITYFTAPVQILSNILCRADKDAKHFWWTMKWISMSNICM